MRNLIDQYSRSSETLGIQSHSVPSSSTRIEASSIIHEQNIGIDIEVKCDTKMIRQFQRNGACSNARC